MKLKDRKWKKCKSCGHPEELTQEESYGCDECKKPIDDLINSGNTRSLDYLEISIHYEGQDARRLQFCSWACCLKKLSKLKRDGAWFVSLPYLSYDNKMNGQRIQDFWKAIKNIK